MAERAKVLRTSKLLQKIIDESDGGTITVGQFTALLGDRAFALVILIFSLPNSLPIPGIPGFSTITGLPITFIAMQMALGRETIWLPKKIAEKEFSQALLIKMLSKAIPAVIWLEKLLRPRMGWVCGKTGERLIGLLFVVLSLIIALPIPGGNFLPGVAMSLIAIGLLEKDGLFIIAAAGFAIGSIVVMYKLIIGGFRWLFRSIGGLFG